MKKLLRALLWSLIEIVLIPEKILVAIVCILYAIYAQIKWKWDKDDWEYIIGRIGTNLDKSFATIFNYIETGKII